MDAQPPFSTIRIPNIDWILWGARALPCPTSLWTGKILRATTSPRYMALGPRGDRDHHWCVVFVRTADARFICLGGRKTRLHEGKGDLGTKTSRGTSWPNTSLTCAADKKRSPRVRIDFGGFISTAVRPVFQHVNVTAGAKAGPFVSAAGEGCQSPSKFSSRASARAEPTSQGPRLRSVSGLEPMSRRIRWPRPRCRVRLPSRTAGPAHWRWASVSA